MVMLMPGLAKREDRLPFAIGSRAQVVTSTVLGAPVTFVERGVGRAFGRTEAFPDASVVSVVLAQATALVRTIYVVRKELAVPGRLAYCLAGLHRKRAVDLWRNQSPSTPSTLSPPMISTQILTKPADPQPPRSLVTPGQRAANSWLRSTSSFTRRHSPIFMTMFKCRRRPETTVVRPSTS